MDKTLHQAKMEIEKLVLSVSDVLPTKIPKSSRAPEMKFRSAVLVGTFIVFAFLLLDCYLYISIQTGSLINQKALPGQWFSPFYPLSVKLIMNAHSDHYVFVAAAEYFNRITKFSKIFPFITPNVISFTHVLITLISFKFFASDTLRSRRIGILLFEIKFFMDTMDGVIYRAHSKNKVFISHRNEFGYYVDTVSDSLGGLLLYLGTCYHYFKCPPTTHLTHFILCENLNFDTDKSSLPSKNGSRTNPPPSKKFIFWRLWCVGFCIIIASICWDNTIKKYESLLQVPGKTEHIQHLQTKVFHETTTFLIMYMWKIINGDNILQFTLFVIFIDKAWDFFSYAQYVGVPTVIMLLAITQLHIHHVEAMLGTSSHLS